MQRTGLTPALLIVLLASWLLISCGGTPRPEQVDLSHIQTPQQWLDLAEQAQEPDKSRYRLNAVQLLLRSGRIDTGRKILNSTQAATSALKQHWLLLSAQLYLNEGNNEQAEADMAQIDGQGLNRAQKNQFYAVWAALARMKKDYWQAAQALSFRYPNASSAQQPQIQQQIWLMLQKSEETMSELPAEQFAPEFAGWLELYRILNGQGELAGVLARLQSWQTRYADHPGKVMLPEDFDAALVGGSAFPESIAVILPLSGKYKEQGLAIRNGMLKALLQKDESPTRLRFYDSTRVELTEIYQQVQQEAHELVVGPLLKSNVKSWLQLNELNLPTLALNQVEPGQQGNHVMFFALSPESDALNAAEFMLQEGIQHPLMLQTASSSFMRISRAFEQAWRDTELEENQFSLATVSNDKMQKQVREVMDVTASRARSKQLSADLGLDLENEPRSRADIDAVYLAASPQQARLLKSFVDVTLSPFAKPVKVMIGPRSHSGNHAEFNGIYVADISLIQDAQHAPLRKQLGELAPQWQYPDWRLFAMGYDVFGLLNQLGAMRQLSGYTVTGLSGELSVSRQGEVGARLHWGRYRNGKLIPLAGS